MIEVTPEVRAAITGGACRTLYLCEIDHPAGTVYINSGVRAVMWNGHTFAALGTMGAVTGMAKSVDARSQEVTLTLASPTLDAAAQDIISQPVQGRSAFVWQAFLTEEWQVIPEPVQLAEITMNSLEVVEGEGGSQTLQITGFMTQYAARRVAQVNYSHENQQARFPGDTGLDRMAELADKVV